MTAVGRRRRPGLIAFFAGPIVWALHFLAIYIYAAVACAHGWVAYEPLGYGEINLVVLGATLLSLAALAATAYANWAYLRRDGDRHLARFLAFMGLGVTALSAVGVLWDAAPALFVTGCA